MKTLLILGAGTGGTMVANKMVQNLDLQEWRIVIVDRDENHYYQPGLLFIPFGIYAPGDVVKPKRNFLPPSGRDDLFGYRGHRAGGKTCPVGERKAGDQLRLPGDLHRLAYRS